MTLSQITLESAASAAKSWKMIILLFVVNFLIALLIAYGFRSELLAGFGSSLLPERMMEGFDATVYNDFLRTNPNLMTPFWGQLFWLIVISFALNTLFGGGIVKGLQRGAERFSVAEFIADCGTYVLRLLLLVVVAGVGLAIIGLVWFFIVNIVYGILSGGAATEVPYVTSFLISAVLFLVPMVTLLMIVDYTKVSMVLDDERSPFRALGTGARFVLKNFLATTAWQWFMIFVAIVLILLYWLIEGNLAMATGFGVFVVFLLQQASVGGRIWVRLATIDGQMRLFESRNQEQPVVSAGFVAPVAESLPPVPSVPVKKTPSRRPAPRRKATPRRGKR